MKAIFSRLSAIVLVLSIAGCAAFVQPQSFDEKLAYSVSVHTAVLDAATISLDAGDLSSEDAENVLKLADESRLVLDAARAASNVGDVATAEGQLALATNVLVQLQAYLRGVQ